MKKKIFYLIAFLFLILSISFLTFSKKQWVSDIKKKVPEGVKTPFRSTVFYIPIKIREYKELNEKVFLLQTKIKKLTNELDAIESRIDAGKFICFEIKLSTLFI